MKRTRGYDGGPPHEARIRRCGTPLAVHELAARPDGIGLGVAGCDGFAVLPQRCEDATSAYAELGSAAADRLSWTALRDGGNNTDGVADTVKAYCGDAAVLARGGRYKQQLLVRGRRAEGLLELPNLVRERRAVLAAASTLVAAAPLPPPPPTPTGCSKCRQSHAGCGACREGSGEAPASRADARAAAAPTAVPPKVSLLTEQLIKYLPSDRWFAPHYDKDRRDKSHEPLDPKTYDGPGDMLATLCLGCECTLLMLPRPGYERPGRAPFCVQLRPGDVYMLQGDARWEWLHGISVPDDEAAARRAVVWRLLID